MHRPPILCQETSSTLLSIKVSMAQINGFALFQIRLSTLLHHCDTLFDRSICNEVYFNNICKTAAAALQSPICHHTPTAATATKLCGCRSHTPHLWASVFSHMSQEVRRCHNSLPLPLPMANIPDQSVHSLLWNPDSTQPPSNQCSWYRRQKHLCNPRASV